MQSLVGEQRGGVGIYTQQKSNKLTRSQWKKKEYRKMRPQAIAGLVLAAVLSSCVSC